MIERWRLNVIFALAAVATIGAPLTYARIEMPFIPTDRGYGEPLEGGWYHGQEHGCFRDSPVHHFANNNIYIRNKRKEVEFADSVLIIAGESLSELSPRLLEQTWFPKDNGAYVALEQHHSAGGPDSIISIYYADSGSRLTPVALVVDGTALAPPLAEFRAVKPHLEFTRCSNPTIWGFIQSLWRRPYDANASRRLVQPKKR